MGSGAQAPDLGTVIMPQTGDEIGPFLDFWSRWLGMKLRALKAAAEETGIPAVVVFEAPMMPQARIDRATGKMIRAPTTIATTRKLQSLSGLLEMECHRAGVPCYEENVATIKKGLTGRGNADKLDMRRAAMKAGVTPSNFDEADAFACWLVAGVRNYSVAHAKKWDKALLGGGGA